MVVVSTAARDTLSKAAYRAFAGTTMFQAVGVSPARHALGNSVAAACAAGFRTDSQLLCCL